MGSFYTFGNMSQYLISYIREYDGIDIRYNRAVWMFTSIAVSYSVGSILGGLLNVVFRIRIKLLVLIGCLLMSSGVALTYYTIKESLLLTTLTYGVMTGFGTGLAYLGPLSMAMRWFPLSKGLATSAILFGYGGSSSLFILLQTLYINPENFSPDKPYSPEYADEKYFSRLHVDLLERIPVCLLILAGIYFPLQMIGISLLSEPNPEIGTMEETTGLLSGASNNDLEGNANNQNNNQNKRIDMNETNSLGIKYNIPTEGMDLKDALRNRNFYMLTAMMSIALIGPRTLVANYKTFGQSFIADDIFLAITGSSANVFNACGRLFWGFLLDKISFKATYLTILGLIVVNISTIFVTKIWAIKWLYLLWVCDLFFVQCGIYATVPPVLAKTFGQKQFTAIYGFVLSSSALSSMSLAMIGLYRDELGWLGFYLVGAACTFAAFILTFFFNVKNGNGRDI